MRTNFPKHIQASKIVDAIVSREVQCLFNYGDGDCVQSQMNCLLEGRLIVSMETIHRYMNLRPELLAKKFIFLPHNAGNNHWWGWAAVNPWCHIAKLWCFNKMRRLTMLMPVGL